MGLYGGTVAATVVNAGIIAGHYWRRCLPLRGWQRHQPKRRHDQRILWDLRHGRAHDRGECRHHRRQRHYAVKFAAGFANRLIADPSAVFTGAVYGGGGVLELASAAGAGTLSGFGTSITNFGSLQFNSGSAWTVSGNDSASGLGTLAITGFTYGERST